MDGELTIMKVEKSIVMEKYGRVDAETDRMGRQPRLFLKMTDMPLGKEYTTASRLIIAPSRSNWRRSPVVVKVVNRVGTCSPKSFSTWRTRKIKEKR